MHPYRSVKPHLGTDCPRCDAVGQGHAQCQGCDEIATTMFLRHATAAEYAALPESLMPIDGVAHQRVDACDDCADAIPDICEHTVPAPVPCPKCGAAGDAPCVAEDGKPRARGNHAARAAAQPTIETCRHVHREDCPVFTGCQCTADDPDPQRPKRPAGDGNGPDVSGLTMPLHIAQMLLASTQHPWTTVVRAWNQQSQDGRPQLAAEVYTLDANGHREFDQHGRWVTATIAIDLQQAV